MYLKIYIAVLSVSIFCLIILTHLQSINYYYYNYYGNGKLIQINYSNATSNREHPKFHGGILSSPLIQIIQNYTSGATSTSSESLSISSANTMGDRRSSKSSTTSTKSKGGKSEGSELEDGTFDGHFDIIKLNSHLKLCIRSKSDNEIDMDEYIFTFQQLYKFFCLLGTVFGFVGSDVKSKLEILQEYRTGENKSHYETVEKMLEFEKSSDFINQNKESSGSRTLLRLHRALNFVSKFLGKVDSLGENEGTYHICKEAYSQTLSKFHPWLIQKGAGLAMLALPLKKDLLNKVCDGRMETVEVTRVLIEVIESTEKVYNQCEQAYTDADLHNLA